MIVIVQPGIGQPLGLFRRQHAERHAGFHAERFHAFDHGDHSLHVALFGITPGRAHAIPRRPTLFCLARLRQHPLDFHEFGSLQTGRISGGLTAVTAIFGAAARFDRKKPAHLDCIGIEMTPVHLLRSKQKIVKG